MRTEIRKVTVEQEVYIAIDGKEFDDEDDCKNHDIEILTESIKCYDENYNEVNNIEGATYVHLVTKKDVETALTICDGDGITCEGFEKPGLYMYNYHRHEWLNLDDVIFHIRGGATK